MNKKLLCAPLFSTPRDLLREYDRYTYLYSGMMYKIMYIFMVYG